MLSSICYFVKMRDTKYALLSELKIILNDLKKEAESAKTRIKCIMSQGNVIFTYQKNIKDTKIFLKTFPGTSAELDSLRHCVIKLNCEMDNQLEKRYPNVDATNGCENKNATLFDGVPCEKVSLNTRLSELKIILDYLQKETEYAISYIKHIVSQGSAIFAFQENIQDTQEFLKSFRGTDGELDSSRCILMKLNCMLDIELWKRCSTLNDTTGIKNNDVVLFESNPCEKDSLNTCLSVLNIILDDLKKEGEYAICCIKCIVSEGNAIFDFQKNNNDDSKIFLKTFPFINAELDSLRNNLVKLDCMLDNHLKRRYPTLYAINSYENNNAILFDGDPCEIVSSNVRLSDLKVIIYYLKREAEYSISRIKLIMSQGNAIFAFQKSVDAENFLKTFPGTYAELSSLLRTIMTLSCELDIQLGERCTTLDGTKDVENNDAVLLDDDPCKKEFVSLGNISSKKIKNVGVCSEIACLNDENLYDFNEVSGLYELEKGSILEMKYLLGDNPSQFWLGYYSDNELQSHLVAVKKRILSGEILGLSGIPRIGQFIIGCVDTVFRGRVLATGTNKDIIAVDIDKGVLKIVNEEDSWEVGDCLLQFPPRALLCQLSCMKRAIDWYTCLGKLFEDCIKHCNLVVTIKDIIPGLIPVFVVDMDAHDNVHLNINVNGWLNSYVLPAIEKMKLDGLDDTVDVNTFHDINPFVMCQEDSASGSVYSSSEELNSGGEDQNSV